MVDETDLELLHFLLKSSRATEAKLDNALGAVGLSMTRLLALRHLDSADEPLSLSQLAGCFSFVKSNATQLIDSLEEDKLVKRVPCSTDRRRTELEITPEGKERHAQALDAMQPILDRLHTLYTPEERALLASLLKRLNDILP